MKTIRRVLDDLRNLRNVDAYVVAAVGVALIVLDVVGSADLGVNLSVVMAALVVLLFRTTAPSNQAVDLDSVLLDRQSYAPFCEFIRGGREVWIYGPSAVNVLHSSGDLKREILDRGGSVRILIQDPEIEASLAILRLQLDPNNVLEHDIKGSLYTLARMQTWGGVEYRLLDYSPGFSMVVVDPDGKDGRLTVEFFGYHNELITDRMHLKIERRSSQYWFEHWVKQYQAMWEAGRPNQ